MAKFDPFLSLDCNRSEGMGRNPREGRDQILQRSVAELKSFKLKGPNIYNLKTGYRHLATMPVAAPAERVQHDNRGSLDADIVVVELKCGQLTLLRIFYFIQGDHPRCSQSPFDIKT